jgi:hypothetical protein
MARPIGIESAGALYHVIVRGNERKAVFRDDGDRNDYLGRLEHYGEKFGFRLLASRSGFRTDPKFPGPQSLRLTPKASADYLRGAGLKQGRGSGRAFAMRKRETIECRATEVAA